VRVLQKVCEARRLNGEDAMDRSRQRKLIKIKGWLMIRIVVNRLLFFSLVQANKGAIKRL